MFQILTIINFVFIITLILFRKYFFSYFSEKGKNLATKEDIESITNKIEKVKSKFTNEYDLLEKRRSIYEDIAKSLRIFISGNIASQQDKNNFLNSYALAYLWAPDSVVEILNHFIELQVEYVRNPESISQEDMKTTYSKCIIEMRKSAGFPETNVDEKSYKFISF